MMVQKFTIDGVLPLDELTRAAITTVASKRGWDGESELRIEREGVSLNVEFAANRPVAIPTGMPC